MGLYFYQEREIENRERERRRRERKGRREKEGEGSIDRLRESKYLCTGGGKKEIKSCLLLSNSV